MIITPTKKVSIHQHAHLATANTNTRIQPLRIADVINPTSADFSFRSNLYGDDRGYRFRLMLERSYCTGRNWFGRWSITRAGHSINLKST